jgi:hypothetical protein
MAYQVLFVLQSSFVVDLFFGLFQVAIAVVVPVGRRRVVVVLLPKRQWHFHNLNNLKKAPSFSGKLQETNVPDFR